TGALLAAAAGFAAACAGALVLGALVVAAVSAGWRPWDAYVYAPGLAAVGACVVLGAVVPLAAWLRRRYPPELLALGPLVVWVSLALVTAAALPGVSHIFTWPAAALLGALRLGEGGGARAAAARALALVPAVLMLTPVIYTLLVVLGAPGVPGAMACLVALLAAGEEPLALVGRRPRQAAALLLGPGLVGRPAPAAPAGPRPP